MLAVKNKVIWEASRLFHGSRLRHECWIGHYDCIFSFLSSCCCILCNRCVTQETRWWSVSWRLITIRWWRLNLTLMEMLQRRLPHIWWDVHEEELSLSLPICPSSCRLPWVSNSCTKVYGSYFSQRKCVVGFGVGMGQNFSNFSNMQKHLII